MERDPELEFKIGIYTYQVWEQSNRQYAVKVIQNHDDDYCDSAWLRHPESRFDTTQGAMYAILLDLEGKF